MEAYFDNNIIVDIEDEKYSFNDVVNKIDSKISIIYYSPAHLMEAKKIKGKNEIEIEKFLSKRFNTISEIMKDNFLSSDVFRKIVPITRIPKDAFNNYSFDFGVKVIDNIITSLFSEKMKEEYRRVCGLNSKTLNNYSSKDIIQHLGTKLNSLGYKSILDMLNFSLTLVPSEWGALQNNIGAVFEFLDSSGYYKDKYNCKSDFARSMDAQHCFYASYCDYFVTNDKKTGVKSKVVYNMFDLSTQVKSYKG